MIKSWMTKKTLNIKELLRNNENPLFRMYQIKLIQWKRN